MYKLKHVLARVLKLKPSIETQPNDAVLRLLAFYCKLVHYICSVAGKLRSLTALDKELCDKNSFYKNKQIWMEVF